MTKNAPPGPNSQKASREIERQLRYSLGQHRNEAAPYELFRALGLAVRQPLIDGFFETQRRFAEHDPKRVYYFSMEFLIGQLLRNNLHNMGIFETYRDAISEFGWDFDLVADSEPDAALGNGGLGRLAACFLDSLATMNLPGYGYGINYDYGLFRQEIENGYQKERADLWLGNESPWMLERPDQLVVVPIYGKIVESMDSLGRYIPSWVGWQTLIGIPGDILVAGHGGKTINFLRLFSARSSRDFNIASFNQGDYFRAIEDKIESEKVSKILYPADTYISGKELRLTQEYFLVSCSVRDIVRRYLERHDDLKFLPDKVAIQLNDTHPALTVAELMRLLVDEQDVEWDTAWQMTQAVCAYTNHTLMQEALERWPVSLFQRLLPRHLQIIFEINRRFLDEVGRRWPGDTGRLRNMSIVEEGGTKQIRMAHLAIVGSHSVNGVAKLHSELLKNELVPDFHALWPERFNNKTNGITHRRWLVYANTELCEAISRAIGTGWIADLSRIRELEDHIDSVDFQNQFRSAKALNKKRLAKTIQRSSGLIVDCNSIFDVQVKRIHEYKRQLLNVMHIVYRYLQIVEDGRYPASPRTFIFAGKAAPDYHMAKLVIKLINSVAAVVNGDPKAKDFLKIVFLADYRVSLAERIVPAADLSEQISMAGTEASGTGNMKLTMNGALTMGTLDGANIEILDEVGRENMYIFGLTSDQIRRLNRNRAYHPMEVYRQSAGLRRVVDAITGNMFSPSEPDIFRPIQDRLFRDGDPYFHLADFTSFIQAQDAADTDFKDQDAWTRRSILNVARMGRFSSDRAIAEYASEIWGLSLD